MRFVKMQGIGNDVICIDCISQDVSDYSSLALLMCRPHFGVGADGIAYPRETASYIKEMAILGQNLAHMADTAVECVYGIPIVHKGVLPCS